MCVEETYSSHCLRYSLSPQNEQLIVRISMFNETCRHNCAKHVHHKLLRTPRWLNFKAYKNPLQHHTTVGSNAGGNSRSAPISSQGCLVAARSLQMLRTRPAQECFAQGPHKTFQNHPPGAGTPTRINILRNPN